MRGGGQEPIKLAEVTNVTTSMTYKQALDALGSSVNTTLYNNLSNAQKASKLFLFIKRGEDNGFVVSIDSFSASNIAFVFLLVGSTSTTAYRWIADFNGNDSKARYFVDNVSSDSTNNNVSLSFAGTWTIYLDV